ncbi:phosphohistidine phosphatase, SixA [Olavius sp. associated proteobacterium Delta 1]|nr:phosphohistidine phosphatase, SixA [Olavius sp. associated proteobacterium Delta 1]
MALYLVQHGKSLPKDVDPDQGLSDEGIAETKRIADVARGYQIKVSLIRQSGKKRARQTAEIYADTLNPAGGVEVVSGLKPLDDVTTFAASLDAAANTMLVGHLPFMERMVSFLVTGSADNPIFRFQNSGMVCLDQDSESGSWVIVWTLMPSIG